MVIESYSFHKITVDGQTYTNDVILLPDRVWDGWWREEGHSLSIPDLEEAFAGQPEVLVVGTGYFGLVQVPDRVRAEIKKRGVELYVLSTRKAWKAYNRLSSGGRRVVAAFHLAC